MELQFVVNGQSGLVRREELNGIAYRVMPVVSIRFNGKWALIPSRTRASTDSESIQYAVEPNMEESKDKSFTWRLATSRM